MIAEKSKLSSLALPCIVWILVVAWRPWVTGFYHDDWAVFVHVSQSNIPNIFLEQASRPIYALALVSLALILPLDPFYYQVALVVITAVCSASVGLLAKTIASYFVANSATALWSGSLAASFWLAAPWGLGFSVWPTTFAAQISVIGFCIIGIVILGTSTTRSKLLKALPIFVGISLISELFWLSFIPLIILLVAIGGGPFHLKKPKDIIVVLSGFVVAQFILVMFNRGIAYVGASIDRSFNYSFFDTALLSIRLLPSEILNSVVFPDILGIAIVIFLFGLFAFVSFYEKRAQVFLVLIAIAVGCLTSIILFALAHYRIQSTGVFSRTTVVITLWLVLIPAVSWAVVEKCKHHVKFFVFSILIGFLVIFSFSSIYNLQSWVRSWKFQTDLLDRFPAENLIEQAEYDAFILVDAVKPENSVEGLEAFWDLGGALLVRYPALQARIAREVIPGRPRRFATMLNRNNMQTTWDGVEIVQSWCHSPDIALWRLPAPTEVYLWSHASRRLSRLENPTNLGCEK
ncbi:hypothetical protein ACQKP1_22985 [Allorhizobium sp. NPDC080224]|uniref:hypothetical protein n=1 Tax=Allorhizobium sp. NPDC080224 TaxID=3390547 RepID=UPI003CFBE0A7